MSELWRQCEGQIVNNQFPLVQFLANTNHSAVFLTKLSQLGSDQAVIKFISADIPAPDAQLEIWNRLSRLDHPQLLRIFHHGRCRIAGMDLLFVVMERADENLSQFLTQRPLTPQETREVLDSMVSALKYLHANGLVHSHVKPSNLLAITDQLKLSSDTILPIGDSREAYRDRDSYDAPENSESSIIQPSAPADVWSLGITLVESLTQQAPPLPFDDSVEPFIPDILPAPFLEIAQHTLLRDPAQRWTVSQIDAHVNPVPAAAAAAASAVAPAPLLSPITGPTAKVSVPASAVAQPALAPEPAPLSVPLSPEPAIPLAKLPVPPPPPQRQTSEAPSEQPFMLPSYVIPVALGLVLVLGLFLTLPKMFRRFSAPTVSGASTSNSASNSVAAKPPQPAPARVDSAPTAAVARPAVQPAAKPEKLQKPSAERQLSAETSETTAPTVVPPAPHSNLATPSASAKLPTDSPDRGEVLDQVLPQVSPKALATIHGTVRVAVRVHVDPSGKVSTANLDSPGPSKYFADLALRAAQNWEFASPVSDGHSLPSEWHIRFEFTPRGVTASPTQTTL